MTQRRRHTARIRPGASGAPGQHWPTGTEYSVRHVDRANKLSASQASGACAQPNHGSVLGVRRWRPRRLRGRRPYGQHPPPLDHVSRQRGRECENLTGQNKNNLAKLHRYQTLFLCDFHVLITFIGPLPKL